MRWAQKQDNQLVSTCSTESKQQQNKVAIDDEYPRLSTVFHTFNMAYQHMPMDQRDFWVGTKYDLFVDLKKKKTTLSFYYMEKIQIFNPLRKITKEFPNLMFLNVFKFKT